MLLILGMPYLYTILSIILSMMQVTPAMQVTERL